MNSSKRSRVRQVVFVTVIGDGYALYQVHDEVGPPLISCTCIQHSSNIRMVHHRQRLPFRFESGDHLLVCPFPA